MRTQSNILPKSILAAFFLCYFSLNHAPAQITNIVSPTNLISWIPGGTVGVWGGIPTNETIFTNMTSMDATGASDSTSALQAAINACPYGEVVAIPAGTFKLTFTQTKTGVIIRGAGLTNTIINFTSGHFERQYVNYDGLIYNGQIVTNVTQGTTVINVADTSGFTSGFAMIAEFNSTNQYDNPLVTGVGVPSPSADSGYVKKQIVRVYTVTPTNITIWPPIYGDMTARPTRIEPLGPTGFELGFENMTINCGDTVGIELIGVFQSWVKNVRINNPANVGISVNSSLGFEIDNCWINGPANSSPNGAGILFVNSSGFLVQNNVILDFFPSIEMFGGDAGGVVAYNFLNNTNGAPYFELDPNHGPHNNFNLYEGNVCPQLKVDGYYGSTAQDTVFRNWVNGQQTGTTNLSATLSLNRFTRLYSVVGNVFSSDPAHWYSPDGGVNFGNPNIGNDYSSGYAPPWPDWGTSPGATGFQELDTNVLQTTTLAGNYYWFTNGIPASQSIGTNTLPASLYLPSAPAWWGTNRWPAIDPYSSPVVTMIPAEERYLGLSSGLGNPPVSSGGGVPAPPADLHPMVATAP